MASTLSLRAGAFAVLAAATAGAWSAALGPAAALLLVAAAVAFLPAASRTPWRTAACALVVWLPTAPLLAGIGIGQVLPASWTALPDWLSAGVAELTVVGTAPVGSDPQAVAAALLLAGVAWLAAGALAAGRSWPLARSGVAFGVAALPWLVCATLGLEDLPVWQGAAMTLAGLLWWASERMAPRPAVMLGLLVALASMATAHAAGPENRWFSALGLEHRDPPRFRVLSRLPTYGPLTDRRGGQPMLEIVASEPALWRMQVLDVFDGQGWRVGAAPAPSLPQPAARSTWAEVRVRGLLNDLIVSPGDVDEVQAPARAHPIDGSAWRLEPPPQSGEIYRVRSEIVRADEATLRRAPVARDRRLRRYRAIGDPLLAPPDWIPYAPVATLARRLATGARSQWEIVARVQHYLLGGDRFRYTTRVKQPGARPLLDFLLRDHAGYCQHFAGAAALLLRFAGVPARVVVGFATGKRQNGRYIVRDVDAHDWIEVYFKGVGWVAFNPTPAAAPAAVAADLVPLGPTAISGAERGAGELVAALGLLGLVLSLWRRSRRRTLSDLLARLAGADAATTLGELALALGRELGPHTAALATEVERVRFAPDPPAARGWPRARIVSALTRDLGLRRALVHLPALR